MLDRIQLVPGFSDPAWKALLPAPVLPSYVARVPSSAVDPPCFVAPSSIKEGPMSPEVVRRALYTAAMDFMSAQHPRSGIPQHQNARPHYRHLQQKCLTNDELQQPQQAASDIPYFHLHTAPGHMTSLMTSPHSRLQDGMYSLYVIVLCVNNINKYLAPSGS